MPQPLRTARSEYRRRNAASRAAPSNRTPAPPPRADLRDAARPQSFIQMMSASVAQGLGFGAGNAIAHEAVRAATTAPVASPSLAPAVPEGGADQTEVSEEACVSILRAYTRCERNHPDSETAVVQCRGLQAAASRCLEAFPHVQA